jgi:D-3-phosphoglycerate dehydrogenase
LEENEAVKYNKKELFVMGSAKQNIPNKHNVFVSTQPFASISPEPLDILAEHNLNVELNQYGRKITQQELKVHLTDKHALIAGTERIDKDVLDCAPELKIIARVGIGLNNIDFDEVRCRGILLTYTPEAVSQAVAELTIAHMLNVMRSIHQIHSSLKNGHWQRIIGSEIAGKTVGLIGFGRIGKRVAKMLQGFSCRILANDIAPDHEVASRYDVKFCRKEDIYRKADIISLHVPATPLTRNLIRETELAMMKSGACLINTARGQIVVESDLYEALKKGEIAGAAIDVFQKEPYSGPLCELENVVLTAHSGSCSTEARCLMESGAAKEVICFFNGEPPLCPVPDEVIQMECSTHTEKVSLEWHEIFNQTRDHSDERYKIYRKRWCQYPTHNIVGPYPLNIDIELVHNPIEKYENGRMADYLLSDLHSQANLMDMSLFYKIIEEFRCIPEPSAIKLGVRGCAINYPYLKDVLLATKDANSVETIISVPLQQLAKVDVSVLDSIVDLGLDVLNIFVNTVDKEVVPFEAFSAIKKRTSMQSVTGPKIRIVGDINGNETDFIEMFTNFWSHWADVIALANPLDSDYKVTQLNWNCSRLWQRLMISAEGNILPCSLDVYEQFPLGSFLETSIQQAWLGDKMNKLRDAHLPNQDACLECSIRKNKLIEHWESEELDKKLNYSS